MTFQYFRRRNAQMATNDLHHPRCLIFRALISAKTASTSHLSRFNARLRSIFTEMRRRRHRKWLILAGWKPHQRRSRASFARMDVKTPGPGIDNAIRNKNPDDQSSQKWCLWKEISHQNWLLQSLNEVFVIFLMSQMRLPEFRGIAAKVRVKPASGLSDPTGKRKSHRNCGP